MDVLAKIENGDYNEKTPYSKETREEWRQERRELQLQFKADLIQAFELDGSVFAYSETLANKFWDMAWEDGHSEGYESVYYHAEELSVLIQLVLEQVVAV